MSLAEVAVRTQSTLWEGTAKTQQLLQRVTGAGATRVDRFVWLIVIAIAVVIALGLLTAWFIYCQNRGGWPALDMPGFSSGGTWKLYCAR